MTSSQPSAPTPPGGMPQSSATPQEQPPTQVSAHEMDRPSSVGGEKNKTGMIVGIIVALLLLVGGGVWGYMYWRSQQPEAVLGRMYEKMSALNSLAYEVDAEMRIEGDLLAEDFADLSFLIGGAPTVADGKAPFVMQITETGAYEGFQRPSEGKGYEIIDADIESILGDYVFSGETRVFGEDYYARITRIPFNFGGIKNQWIEFNTKDLLEGLAVSDDEESMELLEEVTSLSDEDHAQKARELAELVIEKGLVVYSHQLPDVKEGGRQLYVYAFTVDTSKFFDFYLEAFKVYMPEVYDFMMEDVTDEDIDEMRGVFAEFSNASQVSDVVLKVGKKDSLLYGVQFDASMNFYEFMSAIARIDDEFDESDLEEVPENLAASLSVNALLKDHDKPVEVERPEGAVSFMEFIGNLFGGFLGGDVMMDDEMGDFMMDDSMMQDDMMMFDEDAASADSDNDGLSDLEEMLLGTDSQNPDSDGDGFTDKEEIDNGFDPLGPGRLNE